MKIRVILLVLAVTAGVLFSGCVNKSTNSEVEKVSATPTSSPTPVATPVSTEISQFEQNKIIELENKINSMQQQINDLQAIIDRLGLPKHSDKNLIPRVPFRIEIKFGEWQSPTVWTFKETGELTISELGTEEYGTYKLYPNNNTIKMNSKKYDFYGLVLYDDYATAVYENGWIVWAKKYHIIPPTYNPLTQKYELG